VGKYAPQFAGDTQYLIAILQPVFVAVIGGIAWEDAAQKHSGFYEAPSTDAKG
jgi:hypothetical protein